MQVNHNHYSPSPPPGGGREGLSTKRIIFTLLLLLLGLTSFAQEKSLLWQISGKGLQKPSYLFGTIHIICPADYVWTPVMKSTLEKSEKLCLEIDMSDGSALIESMGMMMDLNTKISTYFTPAQYSKLKVYAKDSLELDEEILQHMKPTVIMIMLTTKQASTLCAAPVSYEEKIMTVAEKGKKKVMGLETVAEQFDALNTMPVDTVVKYIMEWVNGTVGNDEREEYMKLIKAYKQQDIASLQTLMQQSESMNGSMDALIDDRNKKWISRMADMMTGTSVFFAVGAGHLAGTNGVINLLKKEGYIVTPLK